MQNKLTGIERELVLKYLQDANVPVTVTPLETIPDSVMHSPTSVIFPVAVQAQKMTILEQGIILLKNPPQSTISFIDKPVRVEFYFNGLGLCFSSKLKEVSSGIALVIPSEINRISETPVQKTNNFKADIFYETDTQTEVHIPCFAAKDYQLFSKPIWSDINVEYGVVAKTYLEKFVLEEKKQRKFGNSVYLIPVCRYLSEPSVAIKALQGRAEGFDILYVNHECIVFAGSAKNFPMETGVEYSVKMSFPVNIKPFSEREVNATCVVSSIYSDNANEKKCAVCSFTEMKEEDLRFVYELSTKNLFI